MRVSFGPLLVDKKGRCMKYIQYEIKPHGGEVQVYKEPIFSDTDYGDMTPEQELQTRINLLKALDTWIFDRRDNGVYILENNFQTLIITLVDDEQI
jgi:hypothetical protein